MSSQTVSCSVLEIKKVVLSTLEVGRLSVLTFVGPPQLANRAWESLSTEMVRSKERPVLSDGLHTKRNEPVCHNSPIFFMILAVTTKAALITTHHGKYQGTTYRRAEVHFDGLRLDTNNLGGKSIL